MSQYYHVFFVAIKAPGVLPIMIKLSMRNLLDDNKNFIPKYFPITCLFKNR